MTPNPMDHRTPAPDLIVVRPEATPPQHNSNLPDRIYQAIKHAGRNTKHYAGVTPQPNRAQRRIYLAYKLEGMNRRLKLAAILERQILNETLLGREW
jgi:hypothetical protein